mgnify:CR=1 FL=1
MNDRNSTPELNSIRVAVAAAEIMQEIEEKYEVSKAGPFVQLYGTREEGVETIYGADISAFSTVIASRQGLELLGHCIFIRVGKEGFESTELFRGGFFPHLPEALLTNKRIYLYSIFDDGRPPELCCCIFHNENIYTNTFSLTPQNIQQSQATARTTEAVN